MTVEAFNLCVPSCIFLCLLVFCGRQAGCTSQCRSQFSDLKIRFSWTTATQALSASQLVRAKSEVAETMRWILVIVVSLGLGIAGTNGQMSCSVKEEHSGEQRFCRFPFIIGWKRYDSCTDFKDPKGKKWCSTKTSNHSVSLHTHVGRDGYWGHCPDDCMEQDVGPCDDFADQGFQCVDADRCNEMCEVITNGSGPSNPFTVRTSQLGCESDKTCSGFNEVCCR